MPFAQLQLLFFADVRKCAAFRPTVTVQYVTDPKDHADSLGQSRNGLDGGQTSAVVDERDDATPAVPCTKAQLS
jgi:hypothetical protein